MLLFKAIPDLGSPSFLREQELMKDQQTERHRACGP